MVPASTPAFSIAARIMCAERSTACTAASAPSFFPFPTGLRTAETMTTSFISRTPIAGLWLDHDNDRSEVAEAGQRQQLCRGIHGTETAAEYHGDYLGRIRLRRTLHECSEDIVLLGRPLETSLVARPSGALKRKMLVTFVWPIESGDVRMRPFIRVIPRPVLSVYSAANAFVVLVLRGRVVLFGLFS